MILLDTHTWVWWNSTPGKLSVSAQQVIEAAEESEEIGLSPISCWEVAMLVEKGRLKLDRDIPAWVEEALDGVTLLPISPSIAVTAGSFGSEFHSDPADRLIVATAVVVGVPLVTRDKEIRSFPKIATVW